MAGRRGDPEPDGADGGTYTLLIALDEPALIAVGALGEVDFECGHYAYTGSAFGPGGFARIDRHRELVCGERTVRHWHVDYLLGHPSARIDSVWISPGDDRECAIARDLPGDPIPGFGASDCDCPAHLVAGGDGSVLAAALAERHDRRHPEPEDYERRHPEPGNHERRRSDSENHERRSPGSENHGHHRSESGE